MALVEGTGAGGGQKSPKKKKPLSQAEYAVKFAEQTEKEAKRAAFERQYRKAEQAYRSRYTNLEWKSPEYSATEDYNKSLRDAEKYGFRGYVGTEETIQMGRAAYKRDTAPDVPKPVLDLFNATMGEVPQIVRDWVKQNGVKIYVEGVSQRPFSSARYTDKDVEGIAEMGIPTSSTVGTAVTKAVKTVAAGLVGAEASTGVTIALSASEYAEMRKMKPKERDKYWSYVLLHELGHVLDDQVGRRGSASEGWNRINERKRRAPQAKGDFTVDPRVTPAGSGYAVYETPGLDPFLLNKGSPLYAQNQGKGVKIQRAEAFAEAFANYMVPEWRANMDPAQRNFMDALIGDLVPKKTERQRKTRGSQMNMLEEVRLRLRRVKKLVDMMGVQNITRDSIIDAIEADE